MRIGIDLMGNDCFPVDLFFAVMQASLQFPEIEFITFLDQESYDQIQKKYFPLSPLLQFKICQNFIRMDDDPLASIRMKKDSSLLLAMQSLKIGHLDALLSAGNTGALMAAAMLLLPRLSFVKRAALLATMPSEKGEIAVIDVGGNISYKASHLIQFAKMGAAFFQCYVKEEIAKPPTPIKSHCEKSDISSPPSMTLAFESSEASLSHFHPRDAASFTTPSQNKKPTVGLLNIGSESKKGTAEIKLAYELLNDLSNLENFEFIGNIEGGDIFKGVANVVVTSGFAGNILLKASEGASAYILNLVNQVIKKQVPEFHASLMTQLIEQCDYEQYNGAIVCGFDRILIKCHGQSSWKGILNGINRAIKLVQTDFLKKIDMCTQR